MDEILSAVRVGVGVGTRGAGRGCGARNGFVADGEDLSETLFCTKTMGPCGIQFTTYSDVLLGVEGWIGVAEFRRTVTKQMSESDE